MKSESNNNISRRQFMGVAGGVTAFAALSSMGLYSGWGENASEYKEEELKENKYKCDVLVIGGGMAGLFAAVKAHDAGASVVMVSKGRLGSSGQTPFAKGIFEYDPETAKYSVDEFLATVSRSALGTNNPVYTRQMVENSKARVAELREWGFFDSSLCNKTFMKPMMERDIPLVERVMITHLIKENDRIAGAAGFAADKQESYVFNAKSVILCTGAGGFKPNGFPICDLTHDGTIMAYNIGAKVTGKEWNDGHAGQSTNPAACYDGWHGMFERKPGTTGIEVHHDLGVDMNYMAYVQGGGVSMGPGMNGKSSGQSSADAGPGPYTPEEFKRTMQGPPQGPSGGSGNGPSGGRGDSGGPGGPPPNGPGEGAGNGPAGRSGRGLFADSETGGGPGGGQGGGSKDGKGGGEGGPPGMGGASVGGSSAGMAIHKSEGLVPINDRCESNITGLYAAGDALGSYMAGAIYTQVGSSLAGSAVQGAVAGEAAAEYSSKVEISGVKASTLKKITEEIWAPMKRENGYSPAWVTQTLQGIMIPNFILYIKKGNLMNAALAYIEELRDHHLPMLRAKDMHELRLAHETANMILSAEMKLKASIMRTESRCSHYRVDYPEVDDQNWQAWINIFKGEDGSMQFEKQAFNS